MDVLQSILSSNPNLKLANLDNFDISNLNQVLPTLKKLEKLEEISLRRNSLSSLPEDLSMLKGVQRLDISQNKFECISEVIDGLKSLPSLEDLKITLASEADKYILVSTLRSLKYLNNEEISISPRASKTLNPELSKTPVVSKIHFQQDKIHFQQELENIDKIFHQIRVLHRIKSPAYENTLINLYEHQVSKSTEEIKKYKSGSATDNIMKTHVINAKFALYDLCMDKMTEYVLSIDPRISNILKSIQSAMQDLQSDLAAIVLGKLPRLENSLLTVKGELEMSKAETSELNQLVQRLEDENKKIVADLMRENTLLSTINVEIPPGDDKAHHQRTKSEFINKDYDILEKPTSPQIPNLTTDFSNLNRDLEKTPKSPRMRKSTSRSKFKGSPRRYFTRPTSPSKMTDITKDFGKLLTLKQLKDVIAEIYASKANYDQKCRENRLPRETLEQHMFSYINNKYGLVKLQKKQLSTLLNSIEKYQNNDCEIALFSKQIQNLIEEKFLFYHHQLKQNFGVAVQKLLQNLYPFKSDAEIRGIFSTNFDKLVFGQQEWTDIVRYIFNEKDTQDLIGIISRHQFQISEVSPSPLGNRKPKKRLSRTEQQAKDEYEQFLQSRIVCADLIQIILDFQLQGHERFLSNFCTIFREIDNDSDGVLSEGQFVDLMYSLKFGVEEDDIERMLRIVDTYGNGQTTFTEIVDMLEQEKIEVNKGMMSILTYVALENTYDF